MVPIVQETVTEQINKAKLIKQLQGQHKEASHRFAELFDAAQVFATAETTLKEAMPDGWMSDEGSRSTSIQNILDGVGRKERMLKAKIDALVLVDGETISMSLREVEELLDHSC